MTRLNQEIQDFMKTMETAGLDASGVANYLRTYPMPLGRQLTVRTYALSMEHHHQASIFEEDLITAMGYALGGEARNYEIIKTTSLGGDGVIKLSVRAV